MTEVEPMLAVVFVSMLVLLKCMVAYVILDVLNYSKEKYYVRSKLRNQIRLA